MPADIITCQGSTDPRMTSMAAEQARGLFLPYTCMGWMQFLNPSISASVVLIGRILDAAIASNMFQ